VLSLVLGIALNQEFVRMLIPLMLGIFWFFGIYQKWVWIPSICTFGLLLFASILQNINEIWLLLCLLSCLMAWDLSYFILDIQQTELIRHQDKIEKEHLTRLTIILGLSLFVLLIANRLSLDLRFGWVLVTSMILIFGFSRAITLIRKLPTDG
jgi:hypothetical protein